MNTIQGPAIFLAQFAGDAAPFNSLSAIGRWAASLGYQGVQIPSWDKRLFERVLPRLSEPAIAQLLQSAHLVDGIVKGLKQPDWPTSGWQALHRLALQVCSMCAAPAVAARPSR